MASYKENFARFGMTAKGIVYLIIGFLTSLAAFGLGGEKSGSKGALKFLAEQSYGKVALMVMALGLLGYVFWRFYQAFGDHEQIENSPKGYVKRFAYLISGIIYGALSYYSISLAMGESHQASSQSSQFMGNTTQVVAIIIGLMMLIKAGYDLYRAYSKKFREGVEEMQLNPKEQRALMMSGKFGHTARGIVIALMAYITLKSGLASGTEIGRQTDAFSYIRNEFGAYALGTIALGFIAYGVYMFIKARYPAMGFK